MVRKTSSRGWRLRVALICSSQFYQRQARTNRRPHVSEPLVPALELRSRETFIIDLGGSGAPPTLRTFSNFTHWTQFHLQRAH
jgi:hypothetical protein